MSWAGFKMLAGGFLLGTVGVKALSGKEAKKVYTKATAAALRGYDEAAKTYTLIKENCEDILHDAKALNAELSASADDEVIEDKASPAVKTVKKTKKS